MHISGIENFSDANGDGFRTVVFVSGCSHHCYNCQNPETWDINNGVLYDENIKNKILNMVSNEHINGITFSGGDPLNENNLADVLDLVNEIRLSFPDKTIWLYSGYTWDKCNVGVRLRGIDEACRIFNTRAEIVENVDVFIDGRYEDAKRDITLKWIGSSNQRVIDVKKSLEKGEVILKVI